MRTVVVYVHGLWLKGGESFLLRRRLCRALNAESRVFPYASWGPASRTMPWRWESTCRP